MPRGPVCNIPPPMEVSGCCMWPGPIPAPGGKEPIPPGCRCPTGLGPVKCCAVGVMPGPAPGVGPVREDTVVVPVEAAEDNIVEVTTPALGAPPAAAAPGEDNKGDPWGGATVADEDTGAWDGGWGGVGRGVPSGARVRLHNNSLIQGNRANSFGCTGARAIMSLMTCERFGEEVWSLRSAI